jgi:hypothetical protein
MSASAADGCVGASIVSQQQAGAHQAQAAIKFEAIQPAQEAMNA